MNVNLTCIVRILGVRWQIKRARKKVQDIMIMTKRLAPLCVAVCLTFTSPAQACRFAPPGDEAARQAAARATVSRATAIIEADVIRPYISEAEPALLRARRVIKGPYGKRQYRVAGATSCHIQFRQIGRAGRVLLFGGPGVYTASMYPSSAEDIDRAIRARTLRRR
jgi:hypothetical protein